jgi:coenzyme F420 biosynthesis associated uncharacterized protein
MQLVDWRVATATATRLVPPGPRVPLAAAVAVVEELRTAAATAEGHVRTVTGLAPAGPPSPVVVVDRPGWISANVEGFAGLLDPLLDELPLGRGGLGPVMQNVGPKVTGAEVGFLLAYLATRVLGQFELLGPAESGRLTLVAPNVVATERAMGVDPHDFRLWVCLHEVTHRVQFAAAPWLHDHVRSLLRDYLAAADLDPAAVVARLRTALGSVVDIARGRTDANLLELVQTPEQRAVLDRVTGLMSGPTSYPA